MPSTEALVWIDLEMTGLDPDKDKIIEIATIITDSDLNLLANGPELVIHQDDALLDGMDEWCQTQHNASGLVQKVKESKITSLEAEEATLEFVKKWVAPLASPLCGNSIHQDRRFLSRYMPRLNDHFSYRNLDVSSIKELARRWYPNLDDFTKENNHTALSDILESVKELRYYREHIFQPR